MSSHNVSPETRRAFMIGAGCAGWSLTGGMHAALAAVDPKSMVPKLMPELTPGFTPADKDEKGIWYQVAQVEEDLKNSNFIIRDAVLNEYLKNLVCSLSDGYCSDTRVYVVRTPYFNASMYPNGMMQVWSGLLLRMRSEAQLAAVLGHEMGHYLRRHTIKQWRSVREKTSIYSFLSLPLAIATAGIGNAVAELALIASIYGYSRDFEREADAYGLQLMDGQNLDPREASKVWGQLIAERDETFKARKTKKPSEPILFATHPAPKERMVQLAAFGDDMVKQAMANGKKYELGQERFSKIMQPWRGHFMSDQIKLNDFGGSIYLIDSLIGGDWDGELTYYKAETHRLRGEPGDMDAAIAYYQKAISLGDVPAELYRGLGYLHFKQNNKDAGKAALQKYLSLKPDAVDRAMVEFSIK
jgi:beta-barrel assembly-enhancing protease